MSSSFRDGYPTWLHLSWFSALTCALPLRSSKYPLYHMYTMAARRTGCLVKDGFGWTQIKGDGLGQIDTKEYEGGIWECSAATGCFCCV